MHKVLFVFGFFMIITGTVLSYYPEFQDFNETDYVVPFYKNEDYPDQWDLLIMSVYGDCGLKDNIFENFSKDGKPICEIAASWVFSLLIIIIAGTAIMCIGGITKESPKKVTKK